MELSPSLFPFRDAGKTLKVNTVWMLARSTDKGQSYKVAMSPPLSLLLLSGVSTMTLTSSNQHGGLHFNQVSGLGIEIVPTDPPWQIRLTRENGGPLKEDPVTKVMEVEDVLLVLGYEWK